jgi:hypothetical protein
MNMDWLLNDKEIVDKLVKIDKFLPDEQVLSTFELFTW